MTLSPIQPSQTRPSKSQPRRQNSVWAKNMPALKQTPPKDSVQFRGAPPQNDEQAPSGETTIGDRLKGAGRAVWQDVSSFKWWAKQTAISSAITLATCWLPGSQLVTIPLWLGVSLALDAVDGLFNPQSHDPKLKELKKQKAEQAQQGWSNWKRSQGATKGAWEGIKEGFTDKFKKKLLISGALCLATCWLPGSQLLLVPALFCTYAACDGTMKGYQGWKNPGLYNVKR